MTEQYDVFASFPYDGKLLAYFQGHFECVFIALQPFSRIQPEYQYILNDVDYDPTLQDFLNYATPISWAEIQQMIDIDDIGRIETAIRSWRLFDKYRDIHVETLLSKLTEEQHIFPPEYDEFQPNMQYIILNTLKYLGYQHIWISDEFDFKREYLNIDDLIDKNILLGTSNLFTPDHKILIGAIHSMSSLFICASKEIIEKMKQFYPLEGFYADDKTEVQWDFSLKGIYFF